MEGLQVYTARSRWPQGPEPEAMPGFWADAAKISVPEAKSQLKQFVAAAAGRRGGVCGLGDADQGDQGRLRHRPSRRG